MRTFAPHILTLEQDALLEPFDWHPISPDVSTSTLEHVQASVLPVVCLCPACAGDDGKGVDEPQAFQPPTSGTVNGLPALSWDQAAVQLNREGHSWAVSLGQSITITYAFRSSVTAAELAQLPAGVSTFQPFNAIQIQAAEEAMRLWAELANINLVRVGSGTTGPGAYSNSATILLGNFMVGPPQFSAFAYLPDPAAIAPGFVEGNVWVNGSRDYDADPITHPRGMSILVHEIGHALGLLHPADYGGGAQSGVNYPTHAQHWQDTGMFTNMSYFSAAFTGANYAAPPTGPQMHDIAAIQRLYGVNMTTRTGDSVYGFNSNTGHSLFTIASASASAVFTIWDAGGEDTIDLSGYATNSEIDLREEAFSSAGPGLGGPAVYNIAIARGAVIENAIGGSGNDMFIGNAVPNLLTGNGGNDTMHAGAGADTLNGDAGLDTLNGEDGADTLNGGEGVDALNGAEGADTLVGGADADALNGADGIDTASYKDASAGVTASLAAPGSNTGDAAGDTYASVENLEGSPFADTLSGDANANVISGLGGSDMINGSDGDDVLYGHSADAAGQITAVAITIGIASSPAAGAATDADPGFIYIVAKDSGVVSRVNETTGARTTFLDIADTEFSGSGERGVLGLAFHPDYAENGRFFVFLTDPQGDLQVREFHRSSDPAVAETTSTLVIEVPKQTGFANHNGGWIGFSPNDGYLYITTGDGGGGGDPANNAQNINSLLGKILRIDVDLEQGDSGPYEIPSDNPFAGATPGANEIWAYGVRNPWRLAFDPRNGDLYIADVGQGAREEVNFEAASAAGGRNYGWRIMEGTLVHNQAPLPAPQPGDPSLIAPVYEYTHQVGQSITGGEVYVGPNEGMTGHYVFVDFVSGRLFSLLMQNGVAVNVAERTGQLTGANIGSITDFVTGADGQLYAIGIGGTVWRLDMGAGAEDLGDTLDGGAGDDQLFGEAGNDTLIGGVGFDTINGGLGDDVISWSWGDGNDAVDGGADVDTFNITGNAASNILKAFYNGSVLTAVAGCTLTGVETVNVNMGGGGDWLQYVGAAGVTANLTTGAASGFASIANIVHLMGGAGDDTLTGDGAVNKLEGGDGDDTLSGGGGNDVLRGGAGHDAFTGGLGNDGVDGGSGNDSVVWIWGDGGDTINGGADTDTVAFNGSAVSNLLKVAYNGTAITSVLGNPLSNVEAVHLNGGGGPDWLIFSNASAGATVNLATGAASGFASISNFVHVQTGAGNDVITGNAVLNKIIAGAGNDRIEGGGGNDTLTGGLGEDTFVYAAGAGADGIMDFDANAAGGQDFLDIAGFGITAGDFASRVSIVDAGTRTIVTIDGSVMITLYGVTGDGDNLITSGDFLLAP